MTIGEKISIVMAQMSDVLTEHEAVSDEPPIFSDDGLAAIIHLFSSALLDRAWELQEKEDMDMEDRSAMVDSLGNKIRELVKVYADVDTKELFL